jgi:hypothetical protein
MANTLSKAGIETSNTVEAWHVTQSIDALTGTDAYDITLSGSLILQNGTQGADKIAVSDVNGEISFTNNITASLQGTASYASQALSSSYATTASYVSGGFTNMYNSDGTLTGNRTVDLNGNTLTFSNGAIDINQGTTNSGEIRLYEDGDFGSNKVVLRAPQTLTTDISFFFPANIGASGQFLSTTGGGATVWKPLFPYTGSAIISGSLTVTSETHFISTKSFSTGGGTLDASDATRISLRIDGTTSTTLSDGTDGQIIYLYCTQQISVGSHTITPSNAADFTSIEFSKVGHTAVIMFMTNKWYLFSSYGATISS